MLAAGVSYAVYTAMLRKRPPVHGLSFLFATFAIGSALLLPFYIAESVHTRPMPLNWHAVLAVGYVAVFASVVAYFCFNRTVELLGANKAGLTVHLVPLFGTLLAVALLGESLHIYHALGIGLIATGILLATRSRVAER
jgi:drug/metabolite transporter (DMT)-like permease